MSLELSIDFFKEKFHSNPSIVEIILPKDNLDQLTSKSHLSWYFSRFYDEKLYFLERIFEYDPSGILIYTKLLLDENGAPLSENQYLVFILSLSSKKEIVDYVLTINKKK